MFDIGPVICPRVSLIGPLPWANTTALGKITVETNIKSLNHQQIVKISAKKMYIYILDIRHL